MTYRATLGYTILTLPLSHCLPYIKPASREYHAVILKVDGSGIMELYTRPITNPRVLSSSISAEASFNRLNILNEKGECKFGH